MKIISNKCLIALICLLNMAVVFAQGPAGPDPPPPGNPGGPPPPPSARIDDGLILLVSFALYSIYRQYSKTKTPT